MGRTGSGKTSFMSALFRICELKAGAIEIDGVDISNLGLGRLRSAMSIIPQDPVIFNGTIRFNLDPFDLYDDAQIYEVLERVQLKDVLASKSESQDQNETAKNAEDTRSAQGQKSVPPATALTVKCSEGGQNLSVGERQVRCAPTIPDPTAFLTRGHPYDQSLPILPKAALHCARTIAPLVNCTFG